MSFWRHAQNHLMPKCNAEQQSKPNGELAGNQARQMRRPRTLKCLSEDKILTVNPANQQLTEGQRTSPLNMMQPVLFPMMKHKTETLLPEKESSGPGLKGTDSLTVRTTLLLRRKSQVPSHKHAHESKKGVGGATRGLVQTSHGDSKLSSPFRAHLQSRKQTPIWDLDFHISKILFRVSYVLPECEQFPLLTEELPPGEGPFLPPQVRTYHLLSHKL